MTVSYSILVGRNQQPGRDGEAERLGGFHIEHRNQHQDGDGQCLPLSDAAMAVLASLTKIQLSQWIFHSHRAAEARIPARRAQPVQARRIRSMAQFRRLNLSSRCR
jgi:hypothetical protein